MIRRVEWVLLLLLLVSCGGPPARDVISNGGPMTPGTGPPSQPSASMTATEVPASLPTTVVAASAFNEHASPLDEDANPGYLDAEVLDQGPVPPLQAAAFLTVTVQVGDTLLGLALEYGVPMAAIQLQNELGSSTVVRLEDRLVIPSRSAWEGAAPFWIVHVVSEGETLSDIGQAYGLTVTQLQGANGLADADRLGIGETLILPLADFPVARTTRPTVVPLPVPSPVSTSAPVLAATPVGALVPADPLEAEAPPPNEIVPPPAGVSAWSYETVRLMNEVRAAHGLPPLAYNETLARAAQIQADDCAGRVGCSHTGSDGSTIKERVLRVGYQPASWAECWALRLTPQGAIDIWMDEVPPNDPHRRTLLTTWLTEVGIGIAEASWGYYFIAVFGRPQR